MQFFSRSIDSKNVFWPPFWVSPNMEYTVYRKKGNMLMQGGAAQLELVYKPHTNYCF